MKVPPILRVVLIAAAVLLIFGSLVLRSCQTAGTARTKAKLATGQAGAAIESGGDAAQTIGNQAAAEAATDALTRENEHAIRTAPGANAPVDPAARDAGLRALCRRAAYRGDPKCMRFAAAP